MPAANYVDLVRSVYEAHGRGEIAAVVPRLHPEIEFTQTPLLPWGGVHRGLAGVQNFFQILAEHIDGGPTPIDYLSAGDSVAVTARLTGKARKTGSAFDMPAVHIWTIKDGLLHRFAAYIDTPQMLAALGIE